jgi:DNA integrity scanning protein DisA with diadenylate cyclase activity
MDDPTRVARLLLESATTIATACQARAIIVAIDALPPVDAVPPRTVLAARDDHDRARIGKLADTMHATIDVPNVELNRLGQVKLAAIMALSNRVVELADTVVFLTGPFRSLIDSLVVMTIGGEYELFDATGQPDIGEHIKRAVFHRVLGLALHLGQHGREGRRIGALLVLGDHRRVLERSEQMILNPFRGYAEGERNVLDDRMGETVLEFSALDGAIVIRGSGVIEAAGTRLKAGSAEALPLGLGARHAAAAGITSDTKSIAISVSGSDGTVRVWRTGRMVAAFEPAPRGS